MKQKTLNYIFIPLALVLFALLVKQLWQLPEGLILPGLMVGMIWFTIIMVGTLFLAFLIKKIYQKTSFLTNLAIVGTFTFGLFYYWVYSPTLKIVVPEGYNGEVSLVLANVRENELIIDTNGIGYINPDTFDRLYMKPEVVDANGTSLDELCVGYGENQFWSNSEQSSSLYVGKVAFHAFKNFRKGVPERKRSSDADVIDLVDWKKVLQPE